MDKQALAHKVFTATGVDGCRAGWLFVSLPSHGPARWGVVREIGELVRCASEADRIFVDIPIGLPDGPGGRACDLEAREKLGTQGSSVLPAPVRAVLDASGDYEDAKRRSREATGKAISLQTFAILPRICEVDALMRRTTKARCLVREVHPEVCFWALNGNKAMNRSKKAKEGFCEPMAVLKCTFAPLPRRRSRLSYANSNVRMPPATTPSTPWPPR